MSEKCKYCGNRIFDEDGQDYGTMLDNGEWVCLEEICELKHDYASLETAAREAVLCNAPGVLRYKLNDAIRKLADLIPADTGKEPK